MIGGVLFAVIGALALISAFDAYVAIDESAIRQIYAGSLLLSAMLMFAVSAICFALGGVNRRLDRLIALGERAEKQRQGGATTASRDPTGRMPVSERVEPTIGRLDGQG